MLLMYCMVGSYVVKFLNFWLSFGINGAEFRRAQKKIHLLSLNNVGEPHLFAYMKEIRFSPSVTKFAPSGFILHIGFIRD